MQLLPGGGREDVCVHWGLRGISTSSGSSALLSARRCLRARRRLFSAQMKKKMIAARIAKSTAAESQYFSSGFDASLLMTSHWFEPLARFASLRDFKLEMTRDERSRAIGERGGCLASRVTFSYLALRLCHEQLGKNVV